MEEFLEAEVYVQAYDQLQFLVTNTSRENSMSKLIVFFVH